jgi:phage N-6-adenine-methyltransferase
VSLVNFRARNHPQQAVRDDVDDRRVDPAFFAELHARHAFTVDAAASAENAMLPKFWTLADDALKQPWGRERVWCNPPYSRLENWLDKAWWEMGYRTDPCALVCMLLPANRCEQGWWQNHVEPFRDRPAFRGVSLTTRFLAGRMRFGWPADRVVPLKGDRPPFGCVLLTWKRAP